MTKQTATPTVTKPDGRHVRTEPGPALAAPPSRTEHRQTWVTTLVVSGVLALMVAIVFAGWSLTRSAPTEITPGAHDSGISQLVRERHAALNDRPLDPGIQRLVDERYRSFEERAHDPTIGRLLREREAEREAALSGHDGWVDRVLRERGAGE